MDAVMYAMDSCNSLPWRLSFFYFVGDLHLWDWDWIVAGQSMSINAEDKHYENSQDFAPF